MSMINDIDLMRHPQTHGLDFVEDINRLRERDPVYWSDASRCWIVTRFQDVSDGFEGKLPLLSGGRNEFSLAVIPHEERAKRIPTLHRYVKHWIVNVDAPQHTRLRKLAMKAFTKKIVESIRPLARARVEALLTMAAEKTTVEFNEEIARPLPGYVLFKLIGFPEKHYKHLREWSNAMVEGVSVANPPPHLVERADWAVGEMTRVILEELNERKENPRDDLLTSLLNSSEGGENLSTDELVATMHIIIIAGHDTTANTMTLGLEALSRHPQAWDYIHRHPENILNCVNELMRYTSMSAGQSRIVATDFQWHGKHLKKDDIVFLSIMGANHDPRVFSHPEKLDFTRNTEKSQVFAPGIHHCIGHLLAKMQLCEFFQALVTRFSSVDILDEPLDFMPVSVFRGMYAMNVRFNPR